MTLLQKVIKLKIYSDFTISFWMTKNLLIYIVFFLKQHTSLFIEIIMTENYEKNSKH